MSGGAHLAGHRIDALSFREGWVLCECGAKFTIELHPDLPPEYGHDALAAIFVRHRKEEATKAEATIAHYKHETLPKV